ncbi:1-aminocyclopropane-1-carboxylate deaminase/D-cysteine desulfhydrase [Butyrivibrio sp. VCB2006]|uniref:1-aminocyclopropane-1-carboxylate deaminase/D-cysteine desulfhydrase n=1 Tax=Butyrivibrio sp. VCB2006 TaxID=1280679 RepID=UPI0003F826B1|nr:pyridoxal-phosphate dependent enzyme [Butyrivibrio sp. VCB2006]
MSRFMAYMTPICKLNSDEFKSLYVKREDMIPYSFGGNKARKAFLFFEDIDKGDYDYVVTYGSSHSNHCRVVANMAAERGMKCVIIGPQEVSDSTYNSRMMELFGAEIITVPVNDVSATIDSKMQELTDYGHKPYFIMGGGHGNIGTQAYVECYDEIIEFEKENKIHFDYIFFASGTGTTQAGLVCGQLIHGDDRKIIGISIARKNPRGRDVVIDSIRDYLNGEYSEGEIQDKTIFLDDYTGDGYGVDSTEIQGTIEKSLVMYGMPLDSTYTGKAFLGMEKYIRQNSIADKNILFIHTGGTPLFFDELNKMRR